MRIRRIGYAVCLLLAACLYFFENNTGTRAVLICAVLIPFIPSLRAAFFAPDETGRKKVRNILTVRNFICREPNEPGDIRAYVPGDPIRQIHWKLSAKNNKLLVRSMDALPETFTEEARQIYPAGRRKKRNVNRSAVCFAAGILLCAAMLLLIPEARLGAQALCNRLFAASEAANAYIYLYFPVPENQDYLLALCLLLCIAGLLAALAVTVRSRLYALGIMTACTLFQVYFGLAFPAWINLPLYGLLAVRMMSRPITRRDIAVFFALLLMVFLAVILFLPGTDAATETASENVRDRLALMAEQIAGTAQEMPPGETETRRIHTRSMETGDREAETEREFRLMTVEEEQIAMPGWINLMKVILMLALAVALVTLPFTPFLVLNARRKKAQNRRKAFGSPDVREAVQAVFRQVVLWLEATGYGAGNLLYRDWADTLPDSLPEGYADRFIRCVSDYEEAVYSNHTMTEEQRQNVLALLEETERAMWKSADRKQRFSLKYWMCLYE